MDTKPTKLSDFVDDNVAEKESHGEASPTPAENARDIEYLIDCVEGLSEQLGTVVDEIEQHPPSGRIETEPTDEETTAERMFH